MDEIEDVSQATATVGIDVDKQTTSVHYTRLFNLGNYENEKIGITVQVLEGQAVQDVIAAAEAEVGKQHQDHQGIREKIAEARQTLWEMERKVRELERKKADLETAIQELAEANPEAVKQAQEDSEVWATGDDEDDPDLDFDDEEDEDPNP
jgi:predicted RNase H-like nuclease (RuvC/YqgF family)